MSCQCISTCLRIAPKFYQDRCAALSTRSIKVSGLRSRSTEQVLAGRISSRTALRLINEWSLASRAELDVNWAKADWRSLDESHHRLSGYAMKALPAVVRAEYRGDYRIHLVFDDGVDATVEFSDWLDGRSL